MEQARVLSYRVLTFERDEEGAFLPPQSYPTLALAVFGNHDLPTLRGWWEGTDIDIKERMQQFASEAEAAAARSQRLDDRRHLLEALRGERLIESERGPDFEELLSAVHAYLGRSRSLLAMAQIDDLAAQADPVNLPNTSTEYPNWRRRLGISLNELVNRPAPTKVATVLREAREGRNS
jgi:4-alpha-glucanotransferase